MDVVYFTIWIPCILLYGYRVFCFMDVMYFSIGALCAFFILVLYIYLLQGADKLCLITIELKLSAIAWARV